MGQSAWGSSQDIHNLILTSALESSGTQNQVDVAVSILNRVTSPQHPNTITDVLYQRGQYEPNFGFRPANTKEEAIARIALKTGNIQAAIAEYETLEAALNDPSQIKASQIFLGGATDFRGQSLLRNSKPGDPYRGNAGANFFLQESRNAAVATAALGTLGIETTPADLAAIEAAAAQTVANRAAYCSQNSGSSNVANIDNSNFEQGSGVASGRLADPLAGQQYKVTSDYGWRNNPTGPGTGFHSGIDLAWDAGTPFKAADGGTVVISDWRQGYGNYILIDHGNGLATWYGHNKVNYVKVGDKVDPGQIIGEVGSTGRSTGPHIDFGVVEGYKKGNIYSGHHVNPRKHVNLPSLGSFSQSF